MLYYLRKGQLKEKISGQVNLAATVILSHRDPFNTFEDRSWLAVWHAHSLPKSPTGQVMKSYHARLREVFVRVLQLLTRTRCWRTIVGSRRLRSDGFDYAETEVSSRGRGRGEVACPSEGQRSWTETGTRVLGSQVLAQEAL